MKNNNIDKLMKEMDVGIADMCILTGTDRDTLYKWRAGIQKPTKAAIMLLEVLRWLSDRGMLEYLYDDIKHNRIKGLNK